MGSSVSSSYKSRSGILLYEPMHYQRGQSAKKVDKKRIKRKMSLRFRHVSLYFLLLVGIFYLIQQCYLFLISWDYLNIKEIDVICSDEAVKQNVDYIMKEKKSVNILLLNIGYLQHRIEEHKWIKEAHIRKVFPATLRIEARLREPVAVLQKEGLYLIDIDGNQLEIVTSLENMGLPLLVDSNNFQKNYEEKLVSAWECLNSLSNLEKDKIKTFDLTHYGWTTLHLRNKKTKIIVGYNNLPQKLKFFEEHHSNLEARFGQIEYIDLRFEDRFYIKPQEKKNKHINPNPKKEIL